MRQARSARPQGPAPCPSGRSTSAAGFRHSRTAPHCAEARAGALRQLRRHPLSPRRGRAGWSRVCRWTGGWPFRKCPAPVRCQVHPDRHRRPASHLAFRPSACPPRRRAEPEAAQTLRPPAAPRRRAPGRCRRCCQAFRVSSGPRPCAAAWFPVWARFRRIRPAGRAGPARSVLPHPQCRSPRYPLPGQPRPRGFRRGAIAVRPLLPAPTAVPTGRGRRGAAARP